MTDIPRDGAPAETEVVRTALTTRLRTGQPIYQRPDGAVFTYMSKDCEVGWVGGTIGWRSVLVRSSGRDFIGWVKDE